MALVNVTATDFETTITENEVVLVDFWASWCGPCRQFSPVFEKVSKDHPEVTFAKVDTEAEQSLAQALQIQSIPTLMAFRDNIAVFSQPGAMNAEELNNVVTQIKGLDMDEVRKAIAKAQEE